jgi:hypothetical protein
MISNRFNARHSARDAFASREKQRCNVTRIVIERAIVKRVKIGF